MLKIDVDSKFFSLTDVGALGGELILTECAKFNTGIVIAHSKKDIEDDCTYTAIRYSDWKSEAFVDSVSAIEFIRINNEEEE